MLERFHYPTDGGEIVLPHFRNIPFGVMRRIRHLAPEEQIYTLLEEVSDEATLAAIDALTVEGVGTLAQAWQSASRVTTGESGASAT